MSKRFPNYFSLNNPIFSKFNFFIFDGINEIKTKKGCRVLRHALNKILSLLIIYSYKMPVCCPICCTICCPIC